MRRPEEGGPGASIQAAPASSPAAPAPRRRFPAGLSELCLLWGLISCTSAFALDAPSTALEEYVGTPDPVYGVAQEESRAGDGYTLHRLKMVSQSWRSPEEADPSVWRHWMVVVVPDRVQGRTAFLIVTGGSSDDPAPGTGDEAVRVATEVATKSHTVAAVLYQVPNQPLRFPDEAGPLAEDALVAYSWDKAMDTGDWGWPIQLPMVKSVVRGMDAVQSTVLRSTNHAVVDRFVLHGYSKRAAAVWLTAAVDPRVRAIAPGVFDFLNFPVQAEHHFRVYGFFTSAVRDYLDYGILERLRTPEGRKLAQVVDPYAYRRRLDMPKLVILATGDQFFIPDAARFYWSDLPGENLLQAIPNVAHSLSRPTVMYRARRRLIAWYAAILQERPRPLVDWHLDDSGRLVVESTPSPVLALRWSAWNPFSRDFRLDSVPTLWLPRPIGGRDTGTFVANLSPPPWGWRADLVELYFPSPLPGHLQVYTTRVFVSPDRLPNRIEQPLRDPRRPAWWRDRIQAALSAQEPEGTEAEALAGYFPIPLFARPVRSLAEAGAILDSAGGTAAEAARAECLALRLNLARDEAGWYSRTGTPERFLWQEWDRAYRAYLGGDPRTAGEVCNAVNRL